jgi:hypothetical protein
MNVKIRMLGGPLHGQQGVTGNLDKCKVFFDERQKQVLLYVRERDITEYLFSPLMSKGLTEKYDEAFAKWGTNNPSLTLIPQEEDGTPVSLDEEPTFSEQPIQEGYREAADGETFLPPAPDFDPDSDSQSGDLGEPAC